MTILDLTLVDDEGNEYPKVSGINLHDKDLRRVPTVTHTIGRIR